MLRNIRLSLSLVLLGLFAGFVTAEDNVPPTGFTALFNGKDLTGWKGLVKDPKERAKMSPEQLAAERLCPRVAACHLR